MTDKPKSNGRADWLQPHEETEGLGRYIETLRERIWLIVAVTVVTTLLAILYVATATKTYQAEADLLITPISSGDTSVQGLALIRESSDPTRDVSTASRLVTTTEVADGVAKQLDYEGDPEALLGEVTAEPVAQSNIVAVTAEASSPEEAADLANAFANQAVKNRTEQLHEDIDARLPALQQREKQTPSPALSDLISALQQLRTGPDPTMQVETVATVPSAPVSPKPKLSIAAGIIAGLILGCAAAFAAQGLDPRMRREEQLRRLYRLPILARIPKEPQRTSKFPLGPTALSPIVSESFRTLRGTVSATVGNGGSKAILVTGSSPSEGKSTTSINLAFALAAAGRKTILIEADLRRPALGRALGITARRGVVSVLIESVKLEDALVPSAHFGSNLQILLADYEGGWISELFALPSALKLIEDAKKLADYVIIDSPPLTDVVDTLPLAREADDVLIVVRPGTTRIKKLGQLGELLAENDIRPMGFAVVGTAPPPRNEGAYYAEKREKMLNRPSLSDGEQPA